MNTPIETLEPRTLFSGSTLAALAAEATLAADATRLQVQLRAYVTTYKADATALKADVKALPKTAANRKRVAAVVKDQARVVGKFAGGEARLAKSAGPAVKRAIAAGTALLVDPTNASLQSKLRVAITAAEARGTGPLTAVGDALESLSTTLFADLSSLAAANPADAALAADVAAAQGHVTDAQTTLLAQFSQVEADAATLLGVL